MRSRYYGTYTCTWGRPGGASSSEESITKASSSSGPAFDCYAFFMKHGEKLAVATLCYPTPGLSPALALYPLTLRITRFEEFL